MCNDKLNKFQEPNSDAFFFNLKCYRVKEIFVKHTYLSRYNINSRVDIDRSWVQTPSCTCEFFQLHLKFTTNFTMNENVMRKPA